MNVPSDDLRRRRRRRITCSTTMLCGTPMSIVSSTMIAVCYVLQLVFMNVGLTSGHVALTYPPARKYDLDFLDNVRTKGPCGMPKGELRFRLSPRTTPIDYRCEDGRFLVFRSCVIFQNPDSLSSSESGVNPVIRSWKKAHDWAWCQKAIRGIYFTKKWRAETLQPGLEFDNVKPRLKSSTFRCISWLKGSFFLGWWSGFSERGSQYLSVGTNVAF